MLDGDGRKLKIPAEEQICSRRKWKSKRGKKGFIQVPIKYVLVRFYLEIKSVEKASFVDSSGKPLHFLKMIRKFSEVEIEISIPSPKEFSSPNISQPSWTKLKDPQQNISNDSILPESLCLKE